MWKKGLREDRRSKISKENGKGGKGRGGIREEREKRERREEGKGGGQKSKRGRIDEGGGGGRVCWIRMVTWLSFSKTHLTLLKRRWIRRVIGIHQQFLPLQLSNAISDISVS